MKKTFLGTRRLATVTALAASMLASSMPFSTMSVDAATAEGKTASEIVKDMTVGWNIGNSLDVVTDSVNYPCKSTQETYWGNPLTSKELIDEVAKAGFNTIRVPVSWGQYTVGDDYEIPDWWMERVREVVDYGIANDMYVILDSHHDVGGKCRFYYPEKNAEEESVKFLSSIWSQIATEFKDYDEKLIFETMNEPRLADDPEEWWFPRNNPSEHIKEAIECINDYNQASVDAIRSAGGKNATRSIMVTGYDTSIDGAMVDGFKLPKDTIDDRIIMAVHAYTPYYFALDGAQPIEKFDDEMARQVDELFSDIDSKFVSKGTPVCISEMGCLKRANNHDERIKWCDYYMGCAEKLKNVACVLWDNNVYTSYADNLGFIDRKTLKWDDPEFIETMMKHADGTPATINGVEVPKPPVNPSETEEPSEEEVQNSSNLEVTNVLNNWGSQFQMLVTVKNVSNKTIDGWKVSLKKKGVDIAANWNAKLTEEGDYFVFSSQSFNSTLKPGETAEFGFQGQGALNKVQLNVSEGTATSGSIDTTEPTKPEDSKSDVKLYSEYSNWGTNYQYKVFIENEGKAIETWEVKVKKSDLNIDKSWGVNIDEQDDCYVLTPFSWNSHIGKGQKISFGIQGFGKCSGENTVFTIK